MLRHGNPEAIYGGQMRPWQPCKSVPASTSHTSTSQGWALHTKALAVPHGTNPGRRNNLTTLNMLLPCCKHTSLTGCFCLRLLWREDHVLISICCTSTIHLHARPQGKHSTHCANRSDLCRKAPAFSVRSDGAYRAYTLRRGWTWLIWKVRTRTTLRTHGTFEIPLSRRHPGLLIFFFPASLCGVLVFGSASRPPPPPPPPVASSHHFSSHHLSSHYLSTHNLSSHTLPSPPPTTSRHTTCLHTTCPHTTCHRTPLLITPLLITPLVITQIVFTLLVHTQLVITHHFSSHNLSSHTTSHHTTCSHTTRYHTTCSLAQTQLAHIQLAHTQLVHTPLLITPLVITPLAHIQLAHTQLVTYGTGLALVARTLWHPPSLCVAGVALDDMDCYFAWQAWHLWHWVGSGGALGSQAALWRRGVLRGRRGTLWHPPSLCVAGVALDDMDCYFAWQAWHLWHWVGSGGALGSQAALWRRGVLRGRRGTLWHPPSLCVAGVALDDMDCYFAWQAWHLWHWVGSGGALGSQVALWRRGVLRGRRGTLWHPPSLCVAGVALDDMDCYFAWQAWHLWHTYIHTSIHPSIHTYIHTCMHTYIHACIHAYIHNLLIPVYTWMLLRKSWRCLRRLDVIGLVCSVLFV